MIKINNRQKCYYFDIILTIKTNIISGNDNNIVKYIMKRSSTLNERYSIAIIGDRNVGKTQILYRYSSEPFKDDS